LAGLVLGADTRAKRLRYSGGYKKLRQRDFKESKTMGEVVSVSTKKGVELAEFLRKHLCEYAEKHFNSENLIENLVIFYGVDVFYGNWILHEINTMKKEDMSLEDAVEFKLNNLKRLILDNVKDERAVTH
jgi:hypothetical protein